MLKGCQLKLLKKLFTWALVKRSVLYLKMASLISANSSTVRGVICKIDI